MPWTMELGGTGATLTSRSTDLLAGPACRTIAELELRAATRCRPGNSAQSGATCQARQGVPSAQRDQTPRDLRAFPAANAPHGRPRGMETRQACLPRRSHSAAAAESYAHVAALR